LSSGPSQYQIGNVGPEATVIQGESITIIGPKVSRPSVGPIFYNLPNLPNLYQPREADLAELRTKLLGSGAAIGITSAGRAIGLKGMGGIGKTVLATALVQDPVLRNAFPHGIAWIRIGRNVSVLAKAAELAFALTGGAISFAGVPEARGQLGLFTAEKRLLVVLDDVWEPGAVDPFTGLGAGCRLLITSRDLRVLQRAQADTHRLDLLDLPSARAFLAEATGLSSARLPPEADEIIRHSGRLPLALAAIGTLIRQRTYPWQDALAALREGAVEELDTSWLPDPEQPNLAVVLKLSVDALSDDVRDCFLACAAFHEDVDIPEAALLRLWSSYVPIERRRRVIAREMADRSLVQRDDQHRYRIHDLYMDYLRHIAAPLAPRHRYLIERYHDACPDGWAGCPDDGYCIQYITWHLREADEHAVLKALLFDPAWIQRKLKSAGLQSLLNDCTLLTDDHEAARLAAALTLSAHLLGANPDLVTVQLCGLLVEEDGPSIAGLLNSLRRTEAATLLPIRGGYLTWPEGLLRTIPAGGPVTTVAVVGDGRRALSGSYGTTVRLWDLESGAELRRFEGDGGAVWAVAPLPDARRALFGSFDGILRLWDLESGAELRRLEGHRDPVWTVAVLADGRRALSGSADRTLRLWDLESGAELQRFEGHDGAIWTVAVLGDGRLALSGSSDTTLVLWDLDSGAELRRFEGHGDWVKAVAVLGDERLALSSSSDRTLRLWDLESGAELRRFEGHRGSVNAVAVLGDGRCALSASDDNTLRLWDLESGAELRRFEAHEAAVRTVALLGEGSHALSGSADTTLLLWGLEGGAEQRRFEGHASSVNAVAVLGGRRRALSSSSDRTLRLWDLKSGVALWRLEHWVTTVVVLQDGRRALFGSYDNMLRLWDLETNVELRRFEGHRGVINTVAVLGDGRRAVSGCSDRMLRLWDLEGGNELRRFEGHGGAVTTVAVLPDGRFTLSGSADKTLRLWDVESGAELQRFEGHDGPVTTVAVLGYGRRALSNSGDKTLRLWDLESGTELRRFEGHGVSVTAVAVLGDALRALAGCDDGTLLLWDLESGAELRRFGGHGASITSVVVLQDGRRALSGSDDGTLQLWDLERGAELVGFVGDDGITSVAISSRWNRAVVGDSHGRVMVFSLPSGKGNSRERKPQRTRRHSP